MSAGSGDDRLYGDEVENVLTGGAGNDVLVGGAANDTLNGGDGRDWLVCGTEPTYGMPTIRRTSWSAVQSPISTKPPMMWINRTWISGASTGGLNGSRYLNAATVFDDGLIDVLYGDGGLDWFFAGGGDRVFSTTGEVINS